MIVVHTANVDVEDGLTNGATGVVKQIDFRMEETNRPSIIQLKHSYRLDTCILMYNGLL